MKYQVSDEMVISVEELRPTDYVADPSDRSIHYDKYSGRQLRLVKRDPSHFDFIFESAAPHIANVAFKGIDLTLFVPIAPEWAQGDHGLEVIALVDREWNRQQVSFTRNTMNLEVKGGDGFEEKGLFSAELIRNCLNAGLWEVMLYTQEDGKKALYYHGWFDFPLGHYKAIFDDHHTVSYWKHWFRLEHWFDPEGTPLALEKLRSVVSEEKVSVSYDATEAPTLVGEQRRKARLFNAENVRCWDDYCTEHGRVAFATFVPPGRYFPQKPWGNRFDKLAKVDRVIHRKIKSPASGEVLDEIELVFGGDEAYRVFLSGIKLSRLPRLPIKEYPRGLYMPMGIGVGPVYQSYEALQGNPPYQSPYFSFILDEGNRWINHHLVGIDGPVMHRDLQNPNKYHLYFLSYERQTLFGHYELEIP